MKMIRTCFGATERIEALDKELEACRVEREKSTGEIEGLSAELSTLTERQSSTEQFLGESQRKMIELETRERQYDFELARLGDQDEELEREAESLSEQA